MAEQHTPIFMESTAREIGKECYGRFGSWLLSDALTEEQRRVGLQEIFAHIAHEGIMTGYGVSHLTTQDERIEAIQLTSEVTGYLNGITDIDEGQGV